MGDPRISVLVDGRVPHFSTRLVHLLRGKGFQVHQLPYLSLKTVLPWICSVATSRAQVVHLLQGHYPFPVYLIPILTGKKLVVHWIGTDVSTECSRANRVSGRLRSRVFSMASRHLTDFAPLRDELARIGIHADVVPLVPHIPVHEDDPWIRGEGVLTYVPENRAAFYGLDLVMKLAAQHPSVPFHVTAHSGRGIDAPENVTFHGWTDDLEGLWRRCKILLRLTRHDGLSHSVIEALSRRKQVIWSQPFPNCEIARDPAEAEAALVRCLARTEPNEAGRTYVRRFLDPERNLDQIAAAYFSAINPRPRG